MLFGTYHNKSNKTDFPPTHLLRGAYSNNIRQSEQLTVSDNPQFPLTLTVTLDLDITTNNFPMQRLSEFLSQVPRSKQTQVTFTIQKTKGDYQLTAQHTGQYILITMYTYIHCTDLNYLFINLQYSESHFNHTYLITWFQMHHQIRFIMNFSSSSMHMFSS